MADLTTLAVHIDPWPIEKLVLHVTQRIRETIQVSTIIEHESDDDGDEHHVLRERGEHYLWAIILEAIGDAGWQLIIGAPAPEMVDKPIPPPMRYQRSYG
jgi:hypothetical protein